MMMILLMMLMVLVTNVCKMLTALEVGDSRVGDDIGKRGN